MQLLKNPPSVALTSRLYWKFELQRGRYFWKGASLFGEVLSRPLQRLRRSLLMSLAFVLWAQRKGLVLVFSVYEASLALIIIIKLPIFHKNSTIVVNDFLWLPPLFKTFCCLAQYLTYSRSLSKCWVNG